MSKYLILIWSPVVASFLTYIVVLLNRKLYSTGALTPQIMMRIEIPLFIVSVILLLVVFVFFLCCMFKKQLELLPHFMLSFILYFVGFILAGAKGAAFIYAT